MNKSTTLCLSVLGLSLLTVDAMADKGWYTTLTEENVELDADKIISDIENNAALLVELNRELIEKSATGDKGDEGDKGEKGDKGMKGDTGARGLAGEHFYAGNYNSLNVISMIAVSNAVANVPDPVSNGFFIGAGFSDLGGKSANAVGIHYVDDAFTYKVTYGHSHHERSIGLGIGIRL